MGPVWKFVIMTAFTHIIVMWLDRGKKGEEEVRGVIILEKSRLSASSHVTCWQWWYCCCSSRTGRAAAVKCLQAATVISRCKSHQAGEV